MVSVIIPMYNAEKYIAECLDSIVSQDYQDVEIIVIDDGSIDNSADIVSDYQKRDGRIKLVRQENHGLVYSRKQGIRESAGDYILFVDSDDWLEHDMTSALVRMLVSDNSDVVASAATFCMGDNRRISRNAAPEGVYQGGKLIELKKRLFCYEDYTTMALLPFLWNKLWKKNLVKKYVLAADEKMTIAEDVAIGFPAILSAGRVTVTNKSFYNYRKTSSSMLNQKKDALKELENIAHVYRNIKSLCAGAGTEDYLAGGLERFMINQLFTRAYPLVENAAGLKGLFPYCPEIPENVVIYGAGELGREIYSYLLKRTNVKCWIDKDAENLKAFGLPVDTIDGCRAADGDTVIVAVFSKRATDSIVRDLTGRGYKKDNILIFKMDDTLEHELIEKMIGD